MSKSKFISTLSESENIFASEQKVVVLNFVKIVAFLLGHPVLLQTFEKFERASSLKLNLEKSEICGIGIKKGCGWRSMDAKLST